MRQSFFSVDMSITKLSVLEWKQPMYSSQKPSPFRTGNCVVCHVLSWYSWSCFYQKWKWQHGGSQLWMVCWHVGELWPAWPWWICYEETWFQQDGATIHTTNILMDLLKFPGRLICRNGDIPWPARLDGSRLFSLGLFKVSGFLRKPTQK